MRVAEISLSKPETLAITDSDSVVVSRERREGRDDWLRLVFSDGTIEMLPGAVDITEQLLYPRILTIRGSHSDIMAIVGGENVFKLQRNKATLAAHLFRDVSYLEYWAISALDLGLSTLLIYESGLALVDDLISVVWQHPKTFDERFEGVLDGKAIISTDDNTKYLIDLETGKRNQGGC